MTSQKKSKNMLKTTINFTPKDREDAERILELEGGQLSQHYRTAWRQYCKTILEYHANLESKTLQNKLDHELLLLAQKEQGK